MILSKVCVDMIRTLKVIRKEKGKEWKRDTSNVKLSVEVCFIDYIYRDILYLARIPLNSRYERIFNLISRNCIEQVIIFRFLEERSKKDPNIFNDYLGDNINISEIMKETDEFEALKQLGGNRTRSYKNKFFEMC